MMIRSMNRIRSMNNFRSSIGSIGHDRPVCQEEAASGILLMAPSDRTAALVLLGGIVFIIGAAPVGVDLTTKNIVLDLAPSASQRPFTIGVNDTLVGIPTALLVGAGAAIDAFGFAPVFVAVGVLALLGAHLAARLPISLHHQS